MRSLTSQIQTRGGVEGGVKKTKFQTGNKDKIMQHKIKLQLHTNDFIRVSPQAGVHGGK